MGVSFEVPVRYEIIDGLGSGAYGTVVAAKETEKDEEGNKFESFVAIKKIERSFEHRVFASRMLRELKIMRLLKHDNILSIKSVMNPGSI
jgi:serine/threonine protein kinase